MPQPIRTRFWRPRTVCSKARGTSGTRPGNRCAISAGGVPAVSAARQTTTPPSSLNSAGVIHGVCCGVASNITCGREGAANPINVESCGSPATAASGRPVRRSKFSPKKIPISRAGQRCPELGAADPRLDIGQAKNNDHGGRHDNQPDGTQNMLPPQRDQVARGDDHRKPRKQQRDAVATDDLILAEQCGDETEREWRDQRENINEQFCERIDRRTKDDRRIIRLAVEVTRIGDQQQCDTGQRKQQARQQSTPTEHPVTKIRHRRQRWQQHRVRAPQPDDIRQHQHDQNDGGVQRIGGCQCAPAFCVASTNTASNTSSGMDAGVVSNSSPISIGSRNHALRLPCPMICHVWSSTAPRAVAPELAARTRRRERRRP